MTETKKGLRFKKTEQKKSFSEMTMVIHGWPKTGKSTIASKFVSGGKVPLFCATEDGHHALNVYSERVSSWEEFQAFVKYVHANAEEVRKAHSCVVIDLISDIDAFCTKFICDKYKLSDLSDLEFGKGFTLKKTEFQIYVGGLMNIIPIVFIAHTKDKKIQLEGVDVEIQAPALPSGTFHYINGKADAIGFILPPAKTKSHSQITFRPNQLAIAGSRYKHMAREFELNPNDMDASFKLINETFIKGIK